MTSRNSRRALDGFPERVLMLGCASNLASAVRSGQNAALLLQQLILGAGQNLGQHRFSRKGTLNFCGSGHSRKS